MIVLNHPINSEEILCIKTFSEQLFYCFPKTNHPTNNKGVYFNEIDGVTMIMPSEVGFWKELVIEKMPNSKFIEQKSNEEINTIIENSTIATFNTNIGIKQNLNRPNRIEIPILDKEATTTYYCICLKKSKIGISLVEKIKQLYKKI